MTEASVLAPLHAMLRLRFPGADVWKIHDVTSKGRPDTVFTYRDHTTWLEGKLLRKGDKLKDLTSGKNALQAYTMTSLAAKGPRHVHAIYVVYDARTRDKHVAIYEPAALMALANPRPDRGYGHRVRDLQDAGAVWADGFTHKFVADFLEELHARA